MRRQRWCVFLNLSLVVLWALLQSFVWCETLRHLQYFLVLSRSPIFGWQSILDTHGKKREDVFLCNKKTWIVIGTGHAGFIELLFQSLTVRLLSASVAFLPLDLKAELGRAKKLNWQNFLLSFRVAFLLQSLHYPSVQVKTSVLTWRMAPLRLLEQDTRCPPFLLRTQV